MRIAIITQPLRTNYGGILQNYALHTVLKRMGHTTTTLQQNELKKPGYLRYCITLAKRLFMKICGKYKYPLLYERTYYRDFPVFTQHTLGFVRRHIKMEFLDYVHPNLSPESFDAYVVGSDQVWRPLYNNIDFTFLSFAKGWNVKRCAYAVSFGTNKWEFSKEQTATCRELAGLFDEISVRETSGIELCSKYLDITAEQVLDPTLLLQRSDYEHLIEDFSTVKSKGDLLVHILDKSTDKNKLVEIISQGNNLEPFEVNCEVDEHEVNEPIEKRIQPPVEQWLRAFMDTKFVVTDSFHATVFSLIFNKPFIVYINEARGAARFQSLLSIFGLDDRVVHKSEDLDMTTLFDIDFNEVNQKIEKLRKKSIDFLKKEF